jgi:NADH-quinone oxidoreductase subunit N
VTASSFDLASLVAILPEILLLLLAAIVMVVDVFLPQERKKALAIVSFVGLIIVLLASVLWRPETELALGGMIRADLTALVFHVLFIVAAGIVCLLSMDTDHLRQDGEYYALVIIAALGLGLMASANDLIMLYVAMELTGITQYLLVGYMRDTRRSSEAGIKYFLFGAVASTVMLYGFSLLYGFTGQTDFRAVAAGLTGVDGPPVLVAMLLVTVGFGFKVAAVPFHFWTPDVYEGAPTPITAYISVASKAAGFAVLVRVFNVVFPVPFQHSEWVNLVETLSIVTMTLGNVLAIPQTNIKRMLAYSSIAQAGYVLIGVAAATRLGIASVIFYLSIYVLTNLAAFALVILVTNKTGSDEIKDFSGLSRRSPYVGLLMLLALLSLGGVPPLAGFFGKFYVFQAAIDAGLVRLAIIGVINAIIGLYYYLNVIKYVFVFRCEPIEEEDEPVIVPTASRWALGVTVFGMLFLGIYATPWYDVATKAAEAFF